MQCTEIKRLTKAEVKKAEESNAGLYLIGVSFAFLFCLNFFSMDLLAKSIFDSFLIPALATLVDFTSAILYFCKLFSILLKAILPHFYYQFYLFIAISLSFHIVIQIYIKYDIVRLWQISQNFGTRDHTIQDDGLITVIDSFLLF
jgi:hypothetical protein